jgi:GntR family transcriptional regulator/MocR family aminotransferase
LHYNIKNILASHGFGNKEDYQNIYINLFDSLKQAIINRTLNEGMKLPPSRVMAKDLEVSRSTVIKAYDLLVLEKYVRSLPGSGYYITSTKNKELRNHFSTQSIKGKYPNISKRGNAFRKNIQLISKRSERGVAFRPGLPPLDIFPIAKWKNLSNDYWKAVRSSELSYSNTLGLRCLRENISNYLKIYRNIDCDADQIIITTGSLHSLSLISDALIDKKDEIVMENPTYPHAYHLFDSLKAKMCAVDIDNEGIRIKSAKCKRPKFVYTTPSNQYPTGVKMSVNRRLEILRWAANKSAIIIEDDYDHEFSNWEKPVSSIFSMDKQERVVYLGTFNKLLHPSIRLGYMIVPHYLLDTITALYEQSSRFVSPPLQKILSAFIEKDYLNKHLRQIIEVSIERKTLFFERFNAQFEEEIAIDSNNTGLHIIGHLKDGLADVRLTNYLEKQGIIAHPFSNYFIGKNKKNGLIMGYSSVNNKLIKETIEKMRREYETFLTQ